MLVLRFVVTRSMRKMEVHARTIPWTSVGEKRMWTLNGQICFGFPCADWMMMMMMTMIASSIAMVSASSWPCLDIFYDIYILYTFTSLDKTTRVYRTTATTTIGLLTYAAIIAVSGVRGILSL